MESGLAAAISERHLRTRDQVADTNSLRIIRLRKFNPKVALGVSGLSALSFRHGGGVHLPVEVIVARKVRVQDKLLNSMGDTVEQ